MDQPINNQKTPDDIVRLVNVSGKGEYEEEIREGKIEIKPHKHVVIHAMYDGQEFIIDKEINVRRIIAESLRKNAFVQSYEANRHRLVIEELPEAMRKPEYFPRVSEDLVTLQTKHDELDLENQNLSEENEALKAKIKELETKKGK